MGEAAKSRAVYRKNVSGALQEKISGLRRAKLGSFVSTISQILIEDFILKRFG
jgi:hypothetical protein